MTFAYDHVETKESIAPRDCLDRLCGIPADFIVRVKFQGTSLSMLSAASFWDQLEDSANKNSADGTEAPYERCAAETTGYVGVSKISRCTSVSLWVSSCVMYRTVPCEGPGFERMTDREIEGLNLLSARGRHNSAAITWILSQGADDTPAEHP